MQNFFHFSERWHHPVAGLRRTLTLIIAILAVESLALAVKGNDSGFSPLYVLAFIRVIDLIILLLWGPWMNQRSNIVSALRDSLRVTLFFGLIGLFFLVIWKILVGSSFLSLNIGVYKQSTTLLITFYATSCLLSPVAEELVFRGLLYRNLRNRWNIWLSIAIVSCLFYLIHIMINGLKWTEALVPLLGSLIFCIGYEKTKHILTPIILHISGNAVIFSSPFIPFL
ncbi:lysostaphin resistance A-like protein [Thermodesulfobacteriota bacterium]